MGEKLGDNPMCSICGENIEPGTESSNGDTHEKFEQEKEDDK